MAQVQATFAVPSICSLHPALNTHPNLVQAYNLNASKAQNGIIASRDVREAEETVSMLQAAQGGLYSLAIDRLFILAIVASPTSSRNN